MPFPWKKVKNTKISQLVTDHLDSQRRLGGPPLVVETGFPTSLVDIVVRNRQRFKKSSKMRKNETNSSILTSPPPSPLSSPPPELSSSSSSSSSPLPSTLLSTTVEETRGESVNELKKEDENFKGVLLAVLRMSFVVVLALGTKKFALGLTMSAFFLFFVEYVGIHVYRLFIPCSEAKKRLRLMVLKFLRIGKQKGENLGFKVSLDQEGQQETYKSGGSDFQDQRSIDPVGKVEIIQPMRFLEPFLEDIQSQEKKSDEFSCDGKLDLQGSDSEVVVLENKEEHSCEVKKRKSRRAKMKTKMKHIEYGNGGEQKSSSDLSSISIGSCEGEEALNIISSSGVLLEEGDVDGVVSREGEEIQNKGNSGYLMLCLIVLIGLFGGKISALMFILSWCFLKKSGGKLVRCLTWPVIRFFNPNA
nr:uncharacterized protein LOC113708218 [Coffea arabica]